jgi:tRNA threonylcarbamoyl adenosine modification protein (Sua5/YciO/YrdC/YwlC family)
VLGADPTSLDTAAALLGAGLVVAIPTDTVYGLAARLDADAPVEALFAAKRRPASVPIAVLCASSAEAVRLAARWPPAAARLAERHWPGPLTVVVDADPVLVARLGSQRGIGLRVPGDARCRALLARTGPLAVTSANAHGAPPATTAAEVVELGAGVAAVVDGGTCGGPVSTVVDLTVAPPTVVREGAVAASEVLGLLSGG